MVAVLQLLLTVVLFVLLCEFGKSELTLKHYSL